MKKKAVVMLLAATMTVGAMPVFSVAAEEGEKVVRIGVAYDPVTLDYAQINSDPATEINSMIGDALLRNKNGEYIGGIAESWESSEDGREWTFVLKEGLTYSDGVTPVTTEDLEYAVKRLLDAEGGYNNADSGFVFVNGKEYYNGECDWEDVGVEVIDDLTIKYTFVNPQYELNFSSTALYAPLEESFVSELDLEYGSAADKVLGNGPFIVSDWQSDSSVTLVKNENYWDADSINIDEFDFIVGATGDTGTDMMIAGELDLWPAGSDVQNQLMEDNGYSSYKTYTTYQGLNLNHSGKTEETGLFLGNANFRKALSLAIDREALSASVLTSAEPANRLVAPNEAGVDGTFQEEFEYEAWPTTADPDLAKEYLNKALEELGKTEDEIPEIELLCYESQSAIDVLSAVQDMLLTNLGIKTVINSQTIQVMISSAMSGDYDLWYGGNGINEPDALEGYLYSYTTEAGESSPLRGYSNEEFDALYQTALSSATIEERRSNFFEIEQFFCDNTMTLLLGWVEGGFYYDSKFENLYYDGGSAIYTYMDIAE
jgi:oligopeptide transport system substrate-binding protein